jgi:hypothetical protein
MSELTATMPGVPHRRFTSRFAFCISLIFRR